MTTGAEERPAARSARAVEVEQQPIAYGINRREFLYYVWGASMIMLAGAGAGALLWYLLPRARAGEFGGDFWLSPDRIPQLGDAPQDHPQGRFWLSHSDVGLQALYTVCTHLGCLYRWVGTNSRFECPCHGSRFQLNGLYLAGPAPRSLDRFELTAILNDNTTVNSDSQGILRVEDPLQIKELIVHTGQRIQGPRAGQAYSA
jgi:cytochrome b6-f complex iron-sulfur subunit